MLFGLDHSGAAFDIVLLLFVVAAFAASYIQDRSH